MKARSLLFGVVFFLWTAFITVPFSFLLVLPRRLLVWHLFVWAKGTMFLLRCIAGVSYRVVGSEYIPSQPALFLVNHQSMWETIIFHILAYRHDPCYIMKRELFFVPFYGLYAWRFGMVGVRRGAGHGQRSLRHLLKLIPKRVLRGQSVIIFPEGTRVPIGEKVEYGIGAWALYRTLSRKGVPTVLVAHNAGCFWERGCFKKLSGEITIRFFEPIEEGLSEEVFGQQMARLRASVESLVISRK